MALFSKVDAAAWAAMSTLTWVVIGGIVVAFIWKWWQTRD